MGTKIVVIVLLWGAALFLGPFWTMWLWGYLFSPKFLMFVFGVPVLTYWKAFWLGLFISAFVVKQTSK